MRATTGNEKPKHINYTYGKTDGIRKGFRNADTTGV